jgi:RNA polymerase sigma factor (sigma-70 family)
MGDISEIEIIQGCKKKKEKYRELLYKRFYGYAMSVSLRYAYSREDALEITNDSFLKAFENITNFDEKLYFKAWFRKILINTSIDNLRKTKKINQHVEFTKIHDEEINPDIISSLNIEDILNLLNDLPEIYRITFNLFEIEGFSHEEIAVTLGIETSTSRANLTRAKKILRQSYVKHFSTDAVRETA